jgi:hypothetical protein
LPPFSRPTPSKWDDAEKWISSPTANRTGRAATAAGIPPKKSAFAFHEHGAYPPAVAKVVAEVPRNAGTLAGNSVGKQELAMLLMFLCFFTLIYF